MQKKNHRRAFGAAAACLSLLACGVVVASPLKNASVVVIMDVAFRGAAGSTVKLVKADGVDAVAVEGANAVIGFEKIAEKAKSKAALSSCTFALRAVDAGAHRVSLGFGALGSVDVTETDVDARILPTFANTKSYAVRVYQKGKLVRSLDAQTKTLALADFDTVHDGAVDALTFDLTFGKERADAWSVTLGHDDLAVVLTPETTKQTLAGAPQAITVQTTAMADGFVLVREAVTVSPL